MRMKKFINAPENLTRELLEGFALAHRELVTCLPGGLVVNNRLSSADRVTVVTQGGSGHEPALSGFVGEGMVDVSAVGDIFAAPGPRACIEALRVAHRGHGVLYIVLNHTGDMLSGNLALKQAEREGLPVRRVVICEDASQTSRHHAADRRGLVGCIPAYKIAGAAAAEGRSIDSVAAVTQRLADNMATLGVVVRGATHPVTGRLLLDLGDDEMELGAGQHGEGGGSPEPMQSADTTAEMMLTRLLNDLEIRPGERVMLLLNGTGATTQMELYIVFRRCCALLEERGIRLAASHVGELLTVQEQAGFQMFLARMDDELLALWNAPCNTPNFKKNC